jgi:hypothetical protein
VKKGWLRDRENPQFLADFNAIVDYLNQNKIRATYDAVTAALAINTQLLMHYLGERAPRMSWILSLKEGKPTGYTEKKVHADLNLTTRLVKDGNVLRQLLDW